MLTNAGETKQAIIRSEIPSHYLLYYSPMDGDTL